MRTPIEPLTSDEVLLVTFTDVEVEARKFT